MIGPPYFQLDDAALLAHFSAAARACAPLPFYVYEFERASGYAVPPAVLERLGEEAPNLAGLKVSDTPCEGFARYLVDGLDVFVGPEAFIAQGLEEGARRSRLGARDRLPGARRRAVDPRLRRDAGRAASSAIPRHAALKHVLRRRGVPIREDVRAPLAAAHGRRATGARRMAGRIVVAGAGAVGASIAYHLALLGAPASSSPTATEIAIGRDRQGDGRRAPAVLDRGGGGLVARACRSSASSARRSSSRSGTCSSR